MPILSGDKRDMARIHIRRLSDAETPLELAGALGDLVAICGPAANIDQWALFEFGQAAHRAAMAAHNDG